MSALPPYYPTEKHQQNPDNGSPLSASAMQQAVHALADDAAVDAFLNSLTDEALLALRYDWQQWARPEQLPPEGDWRGWLILAGRGSGKTRAGAEWVNSDLQPHDRIGLIAPTAADVRDVMVGGESGILACSPPWNLPIYEPSRRRITWPNGAQAFTYSADEPDRLRGPQHTKLWADEVAAWRYGPEAWAMAMMGLRLGDNPQWMATTTPRSVKLVRELLASATIVTRMTSYDNAPHLPPSFFAEIIQRYEGTRLGRQELMAELLTDVPGAFWLRDQLDRDRRNEAPELVRVVVAIDPAVTSGDDADETGIIVCGQGVDGHGYVLADRTCRLAPVQWARRAVTAYHEFKGDRIVAEVNNGGDMVEMTVRTVDPNVSYKKVHASRGKRTRAEPVAALYEQGRVHHVGCFPQLEDQMCGYVPDALESSPDRVDALVWALTDLMLTGRAMFGVVGA